MLEILRFRLRCMQLTEESTRTSLISPVSPSTLISEVYSGGKQYEGQCGRAPVR
jgi:hypothetical protein